MLDRAVIKLVFDKAVSEQHYAPLYARFCAALAQVMPAFQLPVSAYT